ncbi:DUF4276 family protein [Haliscomenobacter sp.]|uniref:DUF4276 family protein n=1 Tax=Haliscomenobacter sp. TaxID=2717303 RepID=UPI0033652884
MKRLRIVTEGGTEETFVNEILRPYLFEKQIFDVAGLRIQTSQGHKGGLVNYQHLKNDVTRILKESNVVVSTFVDFFRIPTSMPDYELMTQAVKADQKIEILENGLTKDFNHPNFIPYIQKFEFEALLFSSTRGFSSIYDGVNPHITRATQAIIDEYDNPEEINSHPNTAPSKRIKRILEAQGMTYNKVFEGNLIALEIGIHTILEKCPRFRAWVEKLIVACSD